MKKKKIIANLATYPARIQQLKAAVASIVSQVDTLNIYLNGYDSVPDFLRDSRIHCVLGKDAAGDLRDNGKFYFLDKVSKDSYYFTIDDDIAYPQNYVKKLLEKLEKYNNDVVVGVHGIVFDENFTRFSQTRETLHFRNYLMHDKPVSLLGTGTLAFHTQALRQLTLKEFTSVGMADIHFAIFCHHQNIPLVAVERKDCWLSEPVEIEEGVQTLWNDALINDDVQSVLIKEHELWKVQPLKEHDNGTFSVIIPCYNLGSLLPTAIDSVFAQTLDDVEVIVVDDASPDPETQKVLDKVERNVHVIRLTENGGVSVARNTGIDVAKGDYILCLDADDTIEPTYLEKAKNVFDADENVGIVSCGLSSFGASNTQFINKDRITLKEALVNAPVHTASCFRKKAHVEGGGYDIQLRGYEDWDHWLRIMKNDWIVRVIPEYLFHYHVRVGSKVETSNKNAFQLVSGIIENHKELYEKHCAYVIAKKHEALAQCDNQLRSTHVKHSLYARIVSLKKKFFPHKLLQ